MGALITVLPVFFPILAGLCLLPVKFKERKQREQWVLTIVVLNAIFALFAIWSGKADAFTLFHFSDKLSLELRMDGLSKVFGTMVSVLWILTTIYGFEYNFLTMYLFYEFLTLVTLPLVMHAMDNKARHAGKMYILYMMFGAALAFIGFVFVYCYGTSIDFVPGGVLNPILVAGHEKTLQLVFIAAFFGFGVKAAVFPLYRWLPKASVAPTPVTALLHAVAVVKSGIFAIIRLTYYSFGTDFLVGTVAQNVMLVAAAITIVFGSTVALRTPHIKRRFAYSTVSNLSYIIFGIALMTPLGLAAALMHMIYHAVLKITLFFTAGAVLYKTHREYLYEVEGFGRLMPVTFAAMTITGIGLVGIPPFAGFHSKWALATAAVQGGNPVSYLGILALIISALLTALYVFYIVVRAYFPRNKEYPAGYYDHVQDPNWYMKGPLIILTVASLVLAFTPGPLMEALQRVVMHLN